MNQERLLSPHQEHGLNWKQPAKNFVKHRKFKELVNVPEPGRGGGGWVGGQYSVSDVSLVRSAKCIDDATSCENMSFLFSAAILDFCIPPKRQKTV